MKDLNQNGIPDDIELPEIKVPDSSWEKFKHSGIKYVVAAILILIFLISILPVYLISIDPPPKNIPSLEEVIPADLTYERINSTRYSDYIIVDSQIKSVADRIATQSCPSNKQACFAKAIFQFVKDNFDYVSDPEEFEYVKTAKESLVNGGGDCDDASVLISTLLNSIGIQTRLVFIPGHVYVEAWIPAASSRYKSDQNWVPMDATCEYCSFGEISMDASKEQKFYEE